MKPKFIFCLAIGLGSAMAFSLFFFWSFGREHYWTQVSEITKFHSGEKLVKEDRFLSAFVQTTLQESKLFIEWAGGKRELLDSTSHYSSVNHYAFSKEGNMYVVGIGHTAYYRGKTSATNQWNSWTMTGTPQIYNYIKNYLHVHSPGSYAPDTNEFAPVGAIKIKCNRLGQEQPLIIAPRGDLPYAYEIETIRNQGRELVAVPFASNPFAPKELIFSRNSDFEGWSFDETLTAKVN
jgi:hypothetical protein